VKKTNTVKSLLIVGF